MSLPSRPPLPLLGAIAAGGVVGAAARYGVEAAFPTGSGFPLGTFLVNVSGSFLIGAVLVLILERLRPSRFLRAFLATGVLGAYTTYATFAVEGELLLKTGHTRLAFLYVLATLAAGLAAVWAGARVGRALPMPPRGAL
ncbi:MAG: fluoride efflux transporter FluC [Acidimicrobiales bacterium]